MVKILIIDDEESIREGLRSIIDWESMNCGIVGEAEDGDMGIELVERLKPDIILTDIRMPGLDGLEFIAKVKELKYNCKTIILTGYRSFDYAQEAVKQGAFRFLLKPSRKEELISAVKAAIAEITSVRQKEETFNIFQKRLLEFYGLQDGNLPESAAQQPKSESGSSTYIAGRAISYMKENYARNINLKDVADELYISTWYLSKQLRKETGKNFVDILNEIRISEAKKLLADPKNRVYNVVEMVGFSNSSYFIRLFKKLVGVTPFEYKSKTVT